MSFPPNLIEALHLAVTPDIGYPHELAYKMLQWYNLKWVSSTKHSGPELLNHNKPFISTTLVKSGNYSLVAEHFAILFANYYRI